ncbi:DnaJ domain-containing protein [Pseudomonas syringae pv. helianthi]|uniref:DnaJ domain-containing protein n=2 Tax=Pseudomonas syringae group genomosp. 7 TaxID=251699 RepID=A0A0P9T2A7_9PSED|nr:DnaJ domain-containing protein [Pseudomonas syringae pv. helianthi]KPY85002.1 DnaJ domain-containing protein [Pseudomonas syringae pv. tagetis]RMR09990.1 DnaJ domain-containing protein [Pseudomonas syringae pv. helianthi]RMW12028.1 DnaJ domain-containing protein [Pseudomonas syringae pv. tagetis]
MTAMDCWSVLDLGHDADERSIKRQYARLLKTTRPDDDPVAFQTLRDAYEQALDWARNRAEDDDEGSDAWSSTGQEHPSQTFDTPVSLARPEHRAVLQASDMAEPPARPAVELIWYEQACQTTPENLHSQRQIAQNQGCDELFQQHLARRCLLDPEDNQALIKAAVEQLQWLTPWQKVQLRAHQSHRLTQALLDSSLGPLHALLERNEERAFLDALTALRQQPWLTSFDRQEQLEQWVMTLLLNNHDWSPALFERLSSLFGWDQKHDVYAGPLSLWMNLVQRCEKKAFIARQQQLLAAQGDTPEAIAARLLLQPPPLDERLRLARHGDETLWRACEKLASDLIHRFPDAMEAFPDADVQSWRKLPQQSSFNPNLRAYFFGALVILTTALLDPSSIKATWYEVAGVALTAPVFLLLVIYVFMSFWRPFAERVKAVDMRWSERLLPDCLSWPGHQALVLRHGIPVVTLSYVVLQTGPVLTALYGTVLLLWIVLSPYRISGFQDAISARTGGWDSVKAYCVKNTFKGIMILLGLMLAFVVGVIVFGPARGH